MGLTCCFLMLVKKNCYDLRHGFLSILSANQILEAHALQPLPPGFIQERG